LTLQETTDEGYDVAMSRDLWVISNGRWSIQSSRSILLPNRTHVLPGQAYRLNSLTGASQATQFASAELRQYRYINPVNMTST